MIRQSRSRKRFLGPTGVAAVALAIAAPAYACTNYVGKIDMTGNSSTNHTIVNGRNCGDNATTSGNTGCTQSMYIDDSNASASSDATAHAGGTLNLTMAAADVGGTCHPNSTTWIGSGVCWLNNSSAIQYPTGPNTPFGYYVDVIKVGFSGHTNPMTASTTPNGDCMHWNGNGSGFTTVATVTVSGGNNSTHTAGAFTAATGQGGYSASILSGTNTLQVAVPSGFPLNISGQQAGLCVSDSNGEDGIQVPFTIN